MGLSDTAINEAIIQGAIGVRSEDNVTLSMHEGPTSRIKTASVDVTLGRELLKYKPQGLLSRWFPRWFHDTIDLADPPSMSCRYARIPTEGYVLKPGEFVLGATREYIRLGPQYEAVFDGRSTSGRLGVLLHITAGYIDPGFHGQITLEIKNVAPYAIRLYHGWPMGQFRFFEVKGEVRHLYGAAGTGSKYEGLQEGPVAPVLKRRK